MRRRMLWQQADFCGVRVITHSILSNHVHLEVRVPAPGVLSDQELRTARDLRKNVLG